MKVSALAMFILLLSIFRTALGQPCDEPAYRGAGILVYGVDAQNEIHLLLAYQHGRGWSSFGGKQEEVVTLVPPQTRCETSQETAVRETVEESRYLLPREMLASKLSSAPFFPPVPGRKDFVTYVVRVEILDTEPYYTTPVVNHSAFTETEAIAWLPLKEVIEHGRFPATPNDQPLWQRFYDGLVPYLRPETIGLLFPTGVKQP